MPLLVKVWEPRVSVPKPLTVPVLVKAVPEVERKVPVSSSSTPALMKAEPVVSEPWPSVSVPDWVKARVAPTDTAPLPTFVMTPSLTSEPPPLAVTLKPPLPLSNSRRAPDALRSTAPALICSEPDVL